MTLVLSQLDQRGVLRLTMNRPLVHNAFDSALIDQMTRAICEAEQDDSVRVLVLNGAGRSFSAGADLNWMQGMIDASEHDNEQDALHLGRLLRSLNHFPHPTIASVHGAALGGGSGLAACCDIVVAADTARFGFTETRLGLVPAMISPYVLDAIGPRMARRYFLSGEQFDAQTAKSMGLVHETCAEHELPTRTQQQVDAVLESGPAAVREAKRLVRHLAGRNRDAQNELDQYTARMIARIRVSAEGQEGLRAFLDKRPPSWRMSEDE